ncbi:MAG: PAS domain-containing protein [gamma proteobacterium symbiont of Bathyaustriella thionipta]|nr:PAS domain-containing protein [gamma proteobacterium symbiont of Bathyaustriella thionipta]MCU7949999.1 PAS domain-containing protein [gamma proteobacterium symbiont of Bathyaustriella thionipta]MCU7952927.1 PAS domain-containing protein [gamma proteobacterium symbiont of Bathyaustriella thionipta]MCU7956589.1 PAS domain-containing protein [gamma proteobacterium symbiont of Bathyaustriella thionipta]MCU7968070.1 PAS domain-containing protein [gamma proteobacterium symbiont of Bathyaustriella
MKHLAINILDNLNAAVVLLDSRLNVLCVNSAAEMLLSISLHKIVTRPIALLLNDDGLIAAIQSALDSNHPFTQRERSIRFIDKKVMVDISVQPIQSEDDDKYLLIELSQLDRHLRISREENLLAQHETIRALLRSMAHEVKNPLGGIRGAAQLLERELENPDLAEYTQVIIDEADRLKKLVNRMLGPNTKPNKTMVNIHSVTERVRSLLKADKTRDVKIFFDYDPSIPEIEFDPEHLIQAVLNIVRNAAQALSEQETSPEAGHINNKKIIIKTRILRHFNIGHKRHKLVAKMDIIDNGPGISEKMQERIFMPLITGRAEGTGLGLSIAQSLVSQNGGLIECHSKPGKTVFSLLLPII